jgi:hypothetical protein
MSADDLGDQVVAGLELHERMMPEPIDWHALFARQPADTDWLVEALWPTGRQLHVSAQRKVGKSLLLLYVAASLAAGRDPFTGHERPPVAVLYVDLEMSEDDLLERLEDMGFTPDELKSLTYYLHPPLGPLDTETGGAELLELVARDGAEAVCLDTVSRVVAGEEDRSDTFRALWRHTGAPLKAAGVALARLDHEGHQAGRSRGSSAKADDVDVVWRLARTDEGLSLQRQHARITWVPERVDLRQLEQPLRFERIDQSWPPGTREIAGLLDQLSAPLDVSRRAAARLLRDAGHAAKNELIGKAVLHRRTRDHLGTTLPGLRGPLPGTTSENPVPPAGTTAGTTGDHLPSPTGPVGPPIGGTTVPDRDSEAPCLVCGKPTLNRTNGRPIHQACPGGTP